ncbi:MAG: DUF4252 domain-containing protein [Saprospiraceae bacterium]|nr:DUF4252 domain-containing protein [Saprospiraceae bacterium]
MKKIIFLIPIFMLALMFSASAQNDAITRFFNQYAEDERFTVVYVAPKLFHMVSRIETDDEDWNKMREIVKDLGGLRVLTADSISDGIALYKTALSKVPTNEYAELLTVRDGNENVRIWTKDTGDGSIIEELLLLVGSPDEFVMLSFTGKINLDKISELSKTLDIDGAKHLDKVKSKNKE